jgi:hypothetical protein
MSNSFPERNKATKLEAVETRFNEHDYTAAERFESPNSIQRKSRNVLKRSTTRFVAALLIALASIVASPNSALAAAAQHHDQVPGFYRLKVGDLEVTALFDGTGVLDPHWLNGTKETMDGVGKALHEDPHMLDVVDSGFLVNTGKQLILVDAGAGTWWVGEHWGAWRAASAARATRRKKSTSFWSRTSIPITSAA